MRNPIVWGSISLALLALVAWRSRAWELGDRLGVASPGPIVAALALNLVIVVGWAARSSDLLAGTGRPVPIRPLIPMTAFANTINNVTPGSVGELVRLYLLRAHHGVEYTAGAAVVVVERFVAFALLGGSAAILWLTYWFGVPRWLAVVALLVLVLIPSLVYRVGIRPSALVRRLPLGRAVGRTRWASVGRALARVDAAVATLLIDPRRAIVFGLWTAVVFASYTGQLLLVAAAIGRTIDPAAAWGALGLGIIVGALSLLPFGLGSTDLVVSGLLVAAGVPAAEAVAITFGYRIVSSLPLGLLGVASYAILSASLPHGHAREAADAASAALQGDASETVDG
ncbi:MAG: lysylphosphatidylglycerol synthase transmembrane domain-containing protein [Chloroflexota bacterium]